MRTVWLGLIALCSWYSTPLCLEMIVNTTAFVHIPQTTQGYIPDTDTDEKEPFQCKTNCVNLSYVSLNICTMSISQPASLQQVTYINNSSHFHAKIQALILAEFLRTQFAICITKHGEGKPMRVIICNLFQMRISSGSTHKGETGVLILK